MLHESIVRGDDASENTKTISQMSALYHVSFRTLRSYEERGLLNPTRRGTQRLYGGKDELRLQLILKGKTLGFSLFEIEKLMLAKVDSHPEAGGLEPAQAAAALLPPTIVQQKIDKLEKMRDDTDQAIAELKQHTQRRQECMMSALQS